MKPKNAFSTIFPVFLSLFSLLFLVSCASSERMARLSGGVISDYSAPKKERITSYSSSGVVGEYSATPDYLRRRNKFQKKTKTFSSATKSARSTFSKESLINIWPFFFRSDDYFSILWPFIDCDDYGFAVRPIVNKEGNDCSILFPVSSWNTAEKSGWLLNFHWHRNGFVFLPLAGHKFDENDGFFFYTPFWIRTWEKHDLTAEGYLTLKEKDFTEFLLGYHSRKVRIDRGRYSYLWTWDASKLSPSVTELLAYDLKGKNVPKNKKEFLAHREKVFRSLGEETQISYGFFPLFHAEETKEKPLWKFTLGTGLLWDGKLTPWEYAHSSLCSLLYRYKYR
ncbi:MAG: hypothetical protein J6331_05135, partial [Lentisphaeria bacterium]|nr:hypothetical protein [Lentisphaeria bacterium]